ncbi:MAG: TonB-dependent receptor [Halieaceae bacterium]|nr:TonB-dependent receptor [Halieaceae bacterium]
MPNCLHDRVHKTSSFFFFLHLASGVHVHDTHAQEANEPVKIEEVLVTGSYIRSTAADNVSSVEIISSDYIINSGAVDVGELTAKWSFVSGSENNPDAFTAGETQGTSNVNLRGLGLSSTLVLINGTRQTFSGGIANDGSVFVDTSTIPLPVIDRVEVLTEGATATYGSDAVAGVVNFILRDEFEGFEISGAHEEIANSSTGKSSFNVLTGFSEERTRGLFAATYYEQDSLSSGARPYTTENAVSSLGRSFLVLGTDASGTGNYSGDYDYLETVPDPKCQENGGVLGSPFVPQGAYGAGTGGGTKCGFLYGPRFNLVNEETKTQLFGTLSHDLSDGLRVAVDVGWTRHEVKDNPQSPSYPNLSFPTILPGRAGSPFDVPVRWYGRPIGAEASSPLAPRKSDTLRTALEIDGRFTDTWLWKTGVTYSRNSREAYQPDTVKSRLNAALAGSGGLNGQETFNPFDPAGNSSALIDWMSYQTYTNKKTDLTVIDFVLSGDIGNTHAGAIGFAAGGQWRKEGFSVNRNELYTQQIDPHTGATVPVDLIFLGGGLPVNRSKESIALFAEANVPLTDALQANLATRFEELETDSSIDSKLGIKWSLTDAITLRASGSTTFREPSLIQTYNQETSLQGLVDPLTGSSSALFVQVNSTGNTDLKPETSINFNAGIIYSPEDNFKLRLDYWSVDYEDVITVQNAQGKLNNDPLGIGILRDSAGTLSGVNVEYLNAQEVNADGIDVAADWSASILNGWLRINLSAAHFLGYEIPCTGQNNRGCTAAGGTQDVVGFFNFDNFARSLPDTKINATLEWSNDSHKFSLLMFYVSDYETTRSIPDTARAAGYSNKVDSWGTLDIQYSCQFNLQGVDTTLTLGAKNLTDEKAPKVYDAANFSYDAKQHDPRGQIWYAQLRAKF